MARLTAHARGRMAGEAGHLISCNPFSALEAQLDWVQGYLKTVVDFDSRRLARMRIERIRRLLEAVRQDDAQGRNNG